MANGSRSVSQAIDWRRLQMGGVWLTLMNWQVTMGLQTPATLF